MNGGHMKYFNLLISNLPSSKSQEEIRQYFEKITEIVDLEIKNNNEGKKYGFIQVKNSQGFQKVLTHHKANWEGSILSIRRPGEEKPVERMIYVSQIPLEITDDELRELFGQFGDIEEIKLIRKQTNSFAFITFSDKDAKIQAQNLKNIQLKGKQIKIAEVASNQEKLEWTLEQLNHKIDELAERVEKDTNYKELESQVKKCHSARFVLLRDGEIGLATSRSIEQRIKTSWDIKQQRLDRANREFESDLSSIEENLYELTADWSTWESCSEIGSNLREVNEYLRSLDLPIDNTKFFEKRIKVAQKQLGRFWLNKAQEVYNQLKVKFSNLQVQTADERYGVLINRYQQLKVLKEELLEFFYILNNPPLLKDARLDDLKSRQRQLWLDTNTETESCLSKFKDAREMVASALESFFEIWKDEQATLRDKYEQLEDVRQLVKETRFPVPSNQWQQLNQADITLNKQIEQECNNFLKLVTNLKNEADFTREPEKLLEEIKELQQVKKTLPLDKRTFAQVSQDLNIAWETLSKRIADRNRRVSEELSKQIDEIQAVIDTENIGNLKRILGSLSDRIKRAQLSRQWKSVEENRIAKLWNQLIKRENQGREEAFSQVREAENALQSDTDIGQVREFVKRVQNNLKQIDLHYDDRQELVERLQQIWEACSAFSDASVQEIEPQVIECELLAEESRFDVVFSKINQVQQLISEKINTQGLARQLYPLRQRLSKAWQTAQEKQSQSASLLESLLSERISACERMAQDNDEQDFSEVFNAIKEAQEVLKERQRGLRLSKSPEEYRTRLERAWKYTSFRAKRCGDETSYLVRSHANEISRMLQTNAHIGQVFNQLHELNNFKRTSWKNKEDIDSLNQVVSSLWSQAKNQAQKQSTQANETALQALERSMIIADRWFDWKYINEQLRETENLLRDLPLPPHQKRPYQELIPLQYKLVEERQQKERDEVFDYNWLLKIRCYCIERGMVDIKNQRWSKDKIQGELSEHDLFVLTHIYDIVLEYSTDRDGNPFLGVEYDETTLDYVIIRKFRLPRIWHQPYTKIRIDFPKSYPHTPPIGWYMENGLTIGEWQTAHHYFPNRAFDGAKVHQGWAWYCCNVKPSNEPGGWHPATLNNPRKKDNLCSYIKVIQSALSSED
jgi:RNA recognition motif. (a.k.a. RRM, RBD, or RNP domain)